MSSFWSNWIIILTVGNILACIWLIWWTMRKRAGEAESGDVTGHTWDEDLQEYNNPLPRWWLWMFWITIIFAAGYLAYFPGLGLFQGAGNWSSTGQYEGEMQQAAEKYDPIFKKYAAIGIADLASKPENEEALAMGKRMYLSYCSQCHGSTATGATGYPNLADNDWLWGGSPEKIKETIMNGRTGVMIPHKGRVEGEQLDQLTDYVFSLSGREGIDAASAEAGKAQFLTLGCIACHGMDGTGNQALGAPNLTDEIWLYGASAGVVKKTILEGRQGVMPAHKEFLGNDKSHLIAAYIYSLSN
ncbi:cytochrome-c oxidase, cbb3-type subunit III [Solemya velum gill symbiont]|uniref:Cbb3-type cytochrome c oxidase subunit n=1 Tax=Solemya velum gill symbiont TaxID=2340 RepID=A0A0B0H972_SOVGS|nr:cytochrome-c oxidase, cbb3-type subunit III [Solemya velum gill symbiont]KHF25212.1 cbb3-type cytochrome c oxidase CooNOQP, subunit P [Solemya velum gill symbiont]OOY34147.1 cytochrome-c oxidase, cbb3-type subunit III [Solemya velum gill symbiont]OOY36845.1 cytochrome-c oxidase, cbb3-type subunit III [Solemya velum gill symbiont]OOY40006.1 cytochrome-c oxidase, cbb3-type subunit III [Solemya velum gill symbiont]OOY43807.1 cytochrome-c oxidase, cbb3-type subunit III [Solemya velum gill symbi